MRDARSSSTAIVSGAQRQRRTDDAADDVAGTDGQHPLHIVGCKRKGLGKMTTSSDGQGSWVGRMDGQHPLHAVGCQLIERVGEITAPVSG